MKPVVLVGGKINKQDFIDYIEKTKYPFVTTIPSYDFLPSIHPQNLGKYNANISAKTIVEQADTVIVLGSDLSFVEVGYEPFAPHATKINGFGLSEPATQEWINIYTKIKNIPEQVPITSEFVNSYILAYEISRLVKEDVVVVTGNATDAFSVFRFWRVKEGQRLIANEKFGAMGWDLPAAIGASIASKLPVLLITGDGSFQLNIQELLTIAQLQLNIKIFILNNGGYASIKRTQDNYCEGRRVACDFEYPFYSALTAAYNINYFVMYNNEDISSVFENMMLSDSPCLCEIFIDPEQERP